MVSINYASREVCCKIVYYGPGLSGKTTNLLYVHSKVPANTRGKMISLATEADRTLYFDFLPINIGTINGFAAKFQLYTVPGQVYYNATRKLVLRGVDGIIFVADSQADKMDENIESLTNLEENLREYGYDINDIPVVIQYNKRDLPGVLTAEQLNARLNVRGWSYFEASATLGNGVFDTLKLIIKMVLEKAKSSSTARVRPAEVTAVHQPSSPTTPEAVASPTSSKTMPERPRPTAAVASVSPPSVSVMMAQPSSPSQPVASGAVEPTEPHQFRPFPGSGREEGLGKKVSPATFSSTAREKSDITLTGQKVMNTEIAGYEDSPAKQGTPVMSPSLRRRSRKKRRGFFKRLFGIK
jgi:signal recognition particle receptor subunit beta